MPTLITRGAISARAYGFGAAGRVKINAVLTTNTQGFNNSIIALASSLTGITYVAGKTDITLTINSGVYLIGQSSTYTNQSAPAGSSGLVITGITGDTIKIINNGYIYGGGGNNTFITLGVYNGFPGGTGGSGLSIGYPVTITNNGTIAGGGGAGGNGGYFPGYTSNQEPGGFGAPANTYARLYGNNGANAMGGGAGGTGGSTLYATGGAGATDAYSYPYDGAGGGGAGLTGAGGSGGGTYGGSYPGGAGGAAGNATIGAGTYATWLVTGTRYGTVA